MKKFLAMLMACAMALTMLCMPVMAEDAVEKAVVETAVSEIVPLQDQIDTLLQDYPFVADILGEQELAGTWLPIMLTNEANTFVDEQGTVGMILTMNADGTATIAKSDGSVIDGYIVLEAMDDGEDQYFFFRMYGKDAPADEVIFDGGFYTDVQFDCLKIWTWVNEDYDPCFFYQDTSKAVVPAVELAPAVSDTNAMAETFGEKTRWTVTDAIVAGIRMVDWNLGVAPDEDPMRILDIARGSELKVDGDLSDNTLGFTINGWKYAMTAVDADGTIHLENQSGDEASMEFTAAQLREDGKLTLKEETTNSVYILSGYQMPSVPLQDQIGHLSIDYPHIIDITQWQDLAGTWYPTVIIAGGYAPYEAQGVMTSKLTLNEDGTAVLGQGESGLIEGYVVIEPVEGNDYFLVNLMDKDTDELRATFILDNDPIYMDFMALIAVVGDEFLVNYYCDAFSPMYVPPVELAPVITDIAAMAETFGANPDWELADTIVDNSRMAMYDRLSGFMMVTRGTPMSVIGDLNDNSLAFQINGVVYKVVAVDADGTMHIEKQGEDDLNPVYLTAHLHEDGLLSMDEANTTDLYKVFTIDPLTEYTDKETVQAVQAAMNAEGFECGTPDGVAGKKTAAAISGFQAANGLTETGTITHELLECLRTKGYDL